MYVIKKDMNLGGKHGKISSEEKKGENDVIVLN